MVINESLLRTHDLATRGSPLSAVELSRLEAWYAAQDADEAAGYRRVEHPDAVRDLQQKIDETLGEIAALGSRVERLVLENDGLRVEIQTLRARFAQSTTPGLA